MYIRTEFRSEEEIKTIIEFFELHQLSYYSGYSYNDQDEETGYWIEINPLTLISEDEEEEEEE